MSFSKADLEQRLRQLRGATMATLLVETLPRVKGGKTAPVVVKRSQVNCVLNFNYSNSVNKQREREGVEFGKAEVEYFEALPRKWGLRVVGTPLVTHRDKVYVETKVQSAKVIEYLKDGISVDFEEIRDILYERGEDGARQEVENPVILRDYSLDSIRQVRIGGEVFNIE